MNILLVGAGAVGQIYGVHLQRGGARVAFFVKPKYRDELARDGMPLWPLQGRDKKKLNTFRDFDLVTTPDEIRAAGPFDQVWMCMSSTALKGPWLPPLLAAIGDATVVSLPPGVEDATYIAARLPEGEARGAARVVRGLITMISYHRPLTGEQPPTPAMAYYRPPGKNPFSGPADRVGPVVAALNAGGWPAKAVPDVSRATAMGSAMMMPVIAGLEVAGWQFRAFGRGEAIRLASAALRQTTQIAAPGFRRGFVRLFATRLNLRAVLFWARVFLPLPLETYLAYHFTKVGDQTRAQLQAAITRGRAAGQPVDAIEALLSRLPAMAKAD